MSSQKDEFQVFLTSNVKGNLKNNQAYMSEHLKTHLINLANKMWL